MDVFTQLYDQPAFHVASLDLRDVQQLPIASFEGFLERLGEWRSTDPLVTKLRRLRVGRGWSRTSRRETDKLVESLLIDNRNLSHFHLYGRAQHLNIGWDIEDYNFGGEMVRDCALPRATRLGLLSVLHHSTAGATLSPDLVQHIWDFGTATWRRVHFTLDEGGAAPGLW